MGTNQDILASFCFQCVSCISEAVCDVRWTTSYTTVHWFLCWSWQSWVSWCETCACLASCKMHEASGWPSIWLPLTETWTKYSSSSSCICIKKFFTFQALLVKLTVWERLWTTCLLMSERFVEHLSNYYMQGWLQASYMTIKFPQIVQICSLSEQFFTSLLFYFSEVLTQNLRVWKLRSIEYRLHLIFKVCWLFFADSRSVGSPSSDCTGTCDSLLHCWCCNSDKFLNYAVCHAHLLVYCKKAERNHGQDHGMQRCSNQENKWGC